MSYGALFQLNLKHRYYSDDICRQLKLTPTDATTRLMSNMNMILNYSDPVYTLYAETASAKTVKHVPRSPFCLSFYLTSENPAFNNFTSLPFFSNDKVCTFDNVEVLSSDDLVLLQPDKYAGPDQVSIRTGLNASVPLDSDETVNIKNALGQIVAEQVPKNKTLAFSAPQGKEGIYTLWQNGELQVRICACALPVTSPLMGYVEIWYAPEVPSKARFLGSGGKISSRSFGISFDARKTHWNYLIVSEKYLHNVSGIAVTNSELSLHFKQKPEVTLFNGQKALSFVSPHPLMLSQQPELIFQLRKNYVKGVNPGTVIINKLPAADGSMIIPRPGEKSPAYSDMIVYV